MSTSRSAAVGARRSSARGPRRSRRMTHLDVGSRERRAGSRWRPGSACSRAGSRASALPAARGRRPGGAGAPRRPCAGAAPARPAASGSRSPRGPSRSPSASAAAAPGSAGRRARSRRVMRRSRRGITQGAVRWNRCSVETRGWICGTNWIALAPVPITATRSPSRSWSWSQVGGVEDRRPRIVAGPGSRAASARAAARRRRPGRGRASGPLEVSSRQRRASSSQRGASTSQPKRTCGRQALVGRDPAQVVADLGLGREGRAPVRVGREGERVDVAGHVAATARVGVLAPGAADLARPLEDDEVVAAGALQPAGHREAGEAAADDRDLDVSAGRSCGMHLGYTTCKLRWCNLRTRDGRRTPPASG